MPERATPYPLPDLGLLHLPPETLAGIAASIVKRVYGHELDDARHGTARLDTVVREHLRPGRYTPATYPAVLALTLGAYLGEVLLRAVDGGRWGQSIENLYGTPLPFIVFTRGEYERQVNVVEDMLTLLWTGEGELPGEYCANRFKLLQRLGFAVK